MLQKAEEFLKKLNDEDLEYKGIRQIEKLFNKIDEDF